MGGLKGRLFAVNQTKILTSIHERIGIKMGKHNIHTTYNAKSHDWRNTSEGATKPSKVFDNKAEAQAAGRQIAVNNKVEHLIHNQDGKIASRNSYGSDPREIKG